MLDLNEQVENIEQTEIQTGEVEFKEKDEIKEEDTEYDAFTDGSTIHRRYRTRGIKKQSKANRAPTSQKNIRAKAKDQELEDGFNCPQCPKTFPSKTGVLNHLRMHKTLANLRFTCALCKSVFDTNAELLKHKQIHSSEDRVFLCKICKEAFTDHCDYLIHELKHTKRPTHKCLECGVYKQPKSIAIHIRTHYDCQLECNICEKKFKGQMSLNGHLKTHQEARFECGECGKMLKSRSEYTFHMNVHIGLKTFQCVYCGAGFHRRAAVKVHTRKHTNERPYRCQLCPKAFYQQTDLKRHQYSHEGKKYECTMCDKNYTHPDWLQKHMNVHNKKKLLYCPECNKACTARQSLRAHMRYAHCDDKPFRCEVCGVDFKVKSQLTRHEQAKAHQRALFAWNRKD